MAKRIWKIHHIWGRDHVKPAFFLSVVAERERERERERKIADTTPTLLGKMAHRKNKHIYSNKFHTFIRGVKGLGSAGKLTDWISALVANASF